MSRTIPLRALYGTYNKSFGLLPSRPLHTLSRKRPFTSFIKSVVSFAPKSPFVGFFRPIIVTVRSIRDIFWPLLSSFMCPYIALLLFRNITIIARRPTACYRTPNKPRPCPSVPYILRKPSLVIKRPGSDMCRPSSPFTVLIRLYNIRHSSRASSFVTTRVSTKSP